MIYKKNDDGSILLKKLNIVIDGVERRYENLTFKNMKEFDSFMFNIIC